MNLTKDNLRYLKETAVTAAYKSGELIMKYFKGDFSIDRKTTGSTLANQIVTEVDLLSQKTIVSHLLSTLEEYDLGLLAEESTDDGSRFEKDFFWCIDPLDGTLQFTESREGFSVSIALVSHSGIPYIGVVYDPVNNIMLHAIKDQGVFRNEEKITFEPDPKISDITKLTGGAVMNACCILDKQSSYFFKKPKPEEGGGCLWDYAASSCIFNELGLHVTDAYGNPLELNNTDSVYMNTKGVLYAASSDIAKRILHRNLPT